VDSVKGVPQGSQGDIKCAVSNEEAIYFVTKGRLFRSSGELWRIGIDGLAVKLDNTAGWGDALCLVLHGSALLGFLDGRVVVVSDLSSPVPAMRECGEDDPLSSIRNTKSATSDGEFLYGVEHNIVGADELWCLEMSLDGTAATAARRVTFNGPEPRSISALVSLQQVEALPGSTWL